MKNKTDNLSETEIVHRQHIIAEACEEPTFIYYVKGYLSGSMSEDAHRELLFEMAKGYLGPKYPTMVTEKTLASEAKEG
jgi:hypothetical protein